MCMCIWKKNWEKMTTSPTYHVNFCKWLRASAFFVFIEFISKVNRPPKIIRNTQRSNLNAIQSTVHMLSHPQPFWAVILEIGRLWPCHVTCANLGCGGGGHGKCWEYKRDSIISSTSTVRTLWHLLLNIFIYFHYINAMNDLYFTI